jgi:hypothetical protein
MTFICLLSPRDWGETDGEGETERRGHKERKSAINKSENKHRTQRIKKDSELTKIDMMQKGTAARWRRRRKKEGGSHCDGW